MGTVRTLLVCVAASLTACAEPATDSAADSQDDPAVKGGVTALFFPTSAWQDERATTWHIPIHGWVYEPQDSVARRAAFAKILEKKYGLVESAATRANFGARINLMIADNKRGRVATIRIGAHRFTLPASEPNGHFQSVFQLSADDVAAVAENGILKFTASLDGAASTTYTGAVFLLAPEGVSVISDIDDTTKISNVLDHQALFDHTFFRDFEPVPGMAELYGEWSRQGAAVHFVSSSPWQLYTPLAEFFHAAGFPGATFELKYVRIKDQTLLNLFKGGAKTKPLQIEPLLKRYPARRFILVGDSGEEDPEVYAALYRKYPQQITRILIRNVTAASEDDARFRRIFAGINRERWSLFSDPSALTGIL